MTSTPNTSQDTVTTVAQPIPPQDLSGIVGYRFIYTYANNWQYEMYVKNATTMDYRIHTGMVGGRWVTDQTIDLVQLDDSVYKVSWTEPTGTSVVVNVLPAKRRLHGTIFFPRWIEEAGSKTVLYQNDHLDEMRAFRDAGPTYRSTSFRSSPGSPSSSSSAKTTTRSSPRRRTTFRPASLTARTDAR